ncbi:MAG: hypothetical protein PHX54_04290 [Lentimicrobiaceae bacterium]|nr:hypothetical protein [Lentimicrobiaceae bacterium]
MTKYIILGFFLCFYTGLHAQFYDIGQEASSTKWSLIEVPGFDFVFPSTYSHQAKRAVQQFTLHAPHATEQWKVKPRKTTIVFHPYQATSNAYAVWAPRRIEVLTTPPQDLYAQPWMEQLALHEYRHMVQLARLDRNTLRYFGWILGQQAVPAATGIFLPTWFLEGDAVMTETAYSHSGRGRVPDFAMPLRAQLIEKNTYSYAKASLGSYRDFVPDHYTLGYHIIAAANINHDTMPWETSLENISRLNSLRPFNYGIMSTVHLDKHNLYQEAMTTLTEMWQPSVEAKEHFININHHTGIYTSISSLSMLNDTTGIFLMSSLDKIPAFYCINLKTRAIKKIHTPGYVSGNHTDGSSGKMVWAEFRPHRRWQMNSYNDLLIYNDSLATVQRFALRKKIYSPVIKRDGSAVAAIEYTREGKPELTIIKGNASFNIALPDTLHAAMPAWTKDENSVFWIATSSQGKAIALTHLKNGATSLVTRYAYREISHPKWHDQHLYYLADCEGVTQLCRLKPEDGKMERITTATYGVGDYAFYNDSILYTSYTSEGYRMAIIANKSVSAGTESGSWPLAAALSDSLEAFKPTATIVNNAHTIKRYRKGKHLFNFHSWAPLYIDADNERIHPGVSIMSQNILSTMFITAGYTFDPLEQRGTFRTSLTWKGWYPEISLDMAGGGRSVTYADEKGKLWDLEWTETNAGLSSRIPLNFSSGPYNRGLIPQLDLTHTNIHFQSDRPGKFFEGNLTTLTYSVLAYAHRRMAKRDLAPRLGANLKLTFRHSPLGDVSPGHIGAIESRVYLPGIGRNHSISAYMAFQKNRPGDYIYANLISFSRGYESFIASNTLVSSRLNYAMPLAYPDVEIRDIIFIKRIRTNLFADFTTMKVNSSQNSYNALGVDVIMDTHILDLPPESSIGIRSIYRTGESDLVFILLWTINLSDF